MQRAHVRSEEVMTCWLWRHLRSSMVLLNVWVMEKYWLNPVSEDPNNSKFATNSLLSSSKFFSYNNFELVCSTPSPPQLKHPPHSTPSLISFFFKCTGYNVSSRCYFLYISLLLVYAKHARELRSASRQPSYAKSIESLSESPTSPAPPPRF